MRPARNAGAFFWKKRTQYVVEALDAFGRKMAKSGMNPKNLQYIMGNSDISVTLNTYTHVRFEDAEEDMKNLGFI